MDNQIFKSIIFMIIAIIGAIVDYARAIMYLYKNAYLWAGFWIASAIIWTIFFIIVIEHFFYHNK